MKMASEAQKAVLKPRFKGIENFLRRIAFNLGNTPSQTEVKIISCIPIDVTDLQNKIVDLERELDERDRGRDESSEDEPRRRTQAHAAIGAPAFTPTAPATHATPAEPIASNHVLDTPKSTTAISPSPSLNAEPPSHVSLSTVESGLERMPKSSTRATIDGNDEVSDLRSAYGYNCTTKKRKMPKLKVFDKKKKGKTQMVYFAQTVYPKNAGEEATHRSRRRALDERELSHTYLTDVVQRQYRPELINMEASTSSGFSWPVCRDDAAGCSTQLHCDSDICSCCHGLFHNVDVCNDADSAAHVRRDCSVYYDSSLYDIVPVKETPSRIMVDNDVYQKRQNDLYLDMEGDYCFNKLKKPRVQFQQPYIAKYCTVAAPLRLNPKPCSKKKIPNKSDLKKEQVMRAMQKRKKDHNLILEPNYSDYVDCGEVYSKPLNPSPRVIMSTTPSSIPTPPPQPLPSSPKPVLKNAECLTTFIERDNHNLVSRSVQLEPPPPLPPAPPPAPPPSPDNKTEITLNQIKSILHAVLTEVKTNAKKQIVLENKSTKDAIVQNGPSQSHIGTNSSYMNNYLYSPRYSFCPYGPSFSGQTTGSQRFYPPGSVMPPPCLFRPDSKTLPPDPPPGPSPCAGAAKCVQNYPLFVHTTGRQCACCYRSVPAQSTMAPACPQPATISNADANKNEQRNKETDNLIKEIYKSLALNTDYPQKDTSSNYTNVRSTVNASNKKFEFRIEPKKKPKRVASEILHNDKAPVFVSKALGEHFGSTAVSYRSEVQTGSTASSAATGSATPRGDGVRSLLSAKKELHSTGSETAHEARERSPTAARNRKYSPISPCDQEYSPPAARDQKYSPSAAHDRRYSPPAARDREYSPPDKRDRQYSPSDKRGRGYSPSETRDRNYSPNDKRERRYSPDEDRGHGTPQTVTASLSDEDTITPSMDDSEESETTVVDTEKKQKKGIFSKMKKLFTARPRRRRKKDEDTTSEMGQEPTSDSDDYETVYSERSSRSGKHSKYQRPSTPPPAPRRRHPRSKLSFSPRHHRRDAPASHSPRYRRESPAPVPAPPRPRRSPYMEQEYRRHWTEDLTFHRTAPPHSSERPYTRSGREYNYERRASPPARGHPGPYWQEYEARPALVAPMAPPLRPTMAPPLRPPMAPQLGPPMAPPLRPPMAPPLRPPMAQTPHVNYARPPPGYYLPAQDQVTKGGQTTPVAKQTYLPQSYKPAAKGLSWLKKINTPTFQCGVQWKNFLLDG